jgi:nucleotide-binding universal stress UspA family protein
MVDTILVPVELPEPEPLSSNLIRALSSLDIVLLGHFELPEQTPASAAREQFEAEARETLERLAEPFRSTGASVKTRLVFGKYRSAAIDQVAIEEDCAAELDPARTERIDRILVPIPDVAEFSRLPEFIDVFTDESTQEITLFHVVEGGDGREQGERILRETSEGLIDAGLDPATVDTRIVEGPEHDDEILRTAAEYDAVVMYEAEPELRDRIFGTLPDRIKAETGDPVIIVRRDYEPRVRAA